MGDKRGGKKKGIYLGQNVVSFLGETLEPYKMRDVLEMMVYFHDDLNFFERGVDLFVVVVDVLGKKAMVVKVQYVLEEEEAVVAGCYNRLAVVVVVDVRSFVVLEKGRVEGTIVVVEGVGICLG